MIGFMFSALVLLLIVVWLIAPALLGKREITHDDTDSQNAEIAKERLADLKLRLEHSEVSQQEFDLTQVEIEKSLLQDVRDGEVKYKPSPKIERNAFVILTAIPLMAVALYWLWGSPDSIYLSAQPNMSQSENAGQATQSSQSGTTPTDKKHVGSVDEMAALLESKLKQDPNNPNGWYTLARTYMSLKKYDQAVAALKRLRGLVGDDATVLVTLADAMTMSRKGRMAGEPFELIKQAYKLKPNDPTTLWLAGLGYEESGDVKTAITMWKKLLPLVAAEPNSLHQVQSLIAAAERKMGIAPTVEVGKPMAISTPAESNMTAAANTASITVTVKLSDAIKSKAAPTDFVLVYARAATGPRMPLAIVRKQVKDLPLTIKLDDSMAMQPTMKLSNFPKVNILARVSKLGQAMPQSGDIQGQFGPVTVKGAKPVTVIVDKVLP